MFLTAIKTQFMYLKFIMLFFQNAEYFFSYSVFYYIGSFWAAGTFVCSFFSLTIAFLYRKQKKKFIELMQKFESREYRISISSDESELSDTINFRKERQAKGRQDIARLQNVTIPTKRPIIKIATKKAERKNKVPHFKNTNILRPSDFIDVPDTMPLNL